MSETVTILQERPDRRLQSLAICIELQKRLRAASSVTMLAYQLVNDTHELVPYRQAALWQQKGSGSLLAVSGLAMPDANAPFTLWMKAAGAVFAAGDNKEGELSARLVSRNDLPPALAADWHEWLPPHALWLPLLLGTDSRGGLLLVRDDKWQDAELKLLGYLGDAASHAWRALEQPVAARAHWRLWPRRKQLQIALGVLLLVALLPVSQTTLAPGEIIAREPVLIRAPLDGVVDQIFVEPNQSVTTGQSLLALDARRLLTQLETARKALVVAEAELRQVQQQGFADSRVNSALAQLRGKVDEQRAEVAYLEELQARINITAPRDGVVIFNDVNDWLGRPVALGERIMEVADPAATEVEVLVPVADAITFNAGARVRLFLNTDPLDPVEAELRLASYQASMTPEGVLAYRLVARIVEPGDNLRIGLKGTAKLYGDRTILLFHVLRRPLQTLRQWLGL